MAEENHVIQYMSVIFLPHPSLSPNQWGIFKLKFSNSGGPSASSEVLLFLYSPLNSPSKILVPILKLLPTPYPNTQQTNLTHCTYRIIISNHFSFCSVSLGSELNLSFPHFFTSTTPSCICSFTMSLTLLLTPSSQHVHSCE